MLSLRWKLGAAFASTILVLVLGAVGLWTFEQERAALDEIERSRALFTSTRTLRQALLDAETGQRGYLLTEDVSYLDPYRAALEQIGPALNDFDLSSRQFDIDEEQLSDLHQLVDDERTHLARTVRMASGGEFERARRLVDTGEGQRHMDQIRRILRDFEGRALESMQSLRGAHAEHRRIAQIVLVAGTATAFTLLMLVYLSIRADIFEQEKVRAALEESNGALARERGRLEAQTRDLENQLERVASLTSAMAAQNAELETRNRDLDQFAYVASHDLRAPLRGISSLAQWIEEDLRELGLPDASRQHLELLKGRVARMEGLIDGVSAYSRAGRSRGDTEPVRVLDVVRDSVDGLEAGEFARISTTLDPLVVLADRMQLAQVLQNLLSNAARHADPEYPEVEIFGRHIEGLVEISVRDNGVGIEERFHERIFGMFQTLAARDDVEATGIGLAVVKKIVEANGGEVRVESGPGKGSTFSFSWVALQADTPR